MLLNAPLLLVPVLVSLALTACAAPYVAYLALAAAAALARGRRNDRRGEGTRFLIVIPAHDEEAGIGATVASCLAIDYDPARFSIVVIADNCADRTAEVARASGARVVERIDPERKSKGHALESFLDDAMSGNRPAADFDAVVIVDADTVVDRDALRTFAGALERGEDWIQGYYSVRNPDVSWRTRLLTFAFSLQNGVLPLGQDRLGASVGLKGNGMCFSRLGLERFPWRAYGLVEDAEFGWMLRIAGERVRFAAGARVFGEMVSRGGTAAASQRRRWESGRRALRGRFFGPIARSRRLGPLAKSAALVDLTMPPLSTLFLALAVASCVHLVAWFVPDLAAMARRLAPVHAALGLGLAAYVVSPFFVLRLPIRYLFALLALPVYLVWKLAVSCRRGPSSWVRTERETVKNQGTL